MCGCLQGQKGVMDSLELELQLQLQVKAAQHRCWEQNSSIPKEQQPLNYGAICQVYIQACKLCDLCKLMKMGV